MNLFQTNEKNQTWPQHVFCQRDAGGIVRTEGLYTSTLHSSEKVESNYKTTWCHNP
jgi:hypothetical protein